MPNFNKTNFQASSIASFKPAELRNNNDWLIVYYSRNPQTGKLQRFRNRVPKITNQKERFKYARKMVETINEKLYSGWSPFLEQQAQGQELRTINFAFDYFLKTIQKEVKDNVKRPNTLKNYTFFIQKLQLFIDETQKNIHFISEITPIIINNYLDSIYMKNSAVTYNAYLKYSKSLFNFFISKGFLTKNPTEKLKLKPITEKIRVVLNNTEKDAIKTLKDEHFHFYIFCMATYYCFIRPIELTKLKVSDVNLKQGFITISSNISKNKKTENVTIPDIFREDLEKHITGANKDFYLFGDKFAPAKIPNKNYGYFWKKIHKKYNFRKEIQFYSLKDTGITDLLNSGVPAIKVRDQARHSDLKITEVYTARNKFADEVIKKATY